MVALFTEKKHRPGLGDKRNGQFRSDVLKHETSYSIYQQEVECSSGKFRKETKIFLRKEFFLWAGRKDVRIFSMLVVETREWMISPWEKWSVQLTLEKCLLDK